MVRHFVICCALFLFLGCGKPFAEKDLVLLNGYWEIELVKFPDGSTKTYKVNANIDYIQVNTKKGFRKKVRPRLDGTFGTSDDTKSFEVIKNADGYIFLYRNGLSQWQESLISISETSFTVKNEANISYTYKRFTPIAIAK
ncbi:MAG: hypothetical protein AAGB24_06055 [Bacteroidota bacterium]